VQIKGIVRLVGTSHFPEIVISAAEMEWFIPKGEAEKLWDLQNRIVTLEGIETVMELKFASGISAGVRREIREVKVLGVE